MDSHYTLKVFFVLYTMLDDMGVLPFYENVLAPANTVFMEPEYEGLIVSRERLKEVARSLNNSVIDIHDSMYDFPQLNVKENLSSTKDLREVFYTKEEGFALYPPDKTDKGLPSVSKPTLDILLNQIKKEISSRGK